MSSVVDTRQAATVVFKVLGVVWLLRAIGDIPGLIGVLSTPPDRFSAGDYRLVIAARFVAFGLRVVIGWLLIAKGGAIARLLLAPDTSIEIEMTAEDSLAVALAAIGVAIAASSIPTLGEAIVNFKYLKDTGGAYTRGTWMRGNWVALLGSVGEVVVGIGLFMSSRSLAVLWSERGRRGVKERGGNDAAP